VAWLPGLRALLAGRGGGSPRRFVIKPERALPSLDATAAHQHRNPPFPDARAEHEEADLRRAGGVHGRALRGEAVCVVLRLGETCASLLNVLVIGWAVVVVCLGLRCEGGCLTGRVVCGA